MGIGADDWFVCMHARDTSYLREWRPEYADAWDKVDFKNASIESYVKAAEYIAAQGGFVLRYGAVVEKPFPVTDNPRIIDYATKHRSDFMDIFLAAHRSRLSRSGVWLAGRAIRLAAAEPTIASRPRARGGVVGGPRSRRSRPLVSRFLLPAAQRHVALGQQAVPGKEGLVEPGMSRTGQKSRESSATYSAGAGRVAEYGLSGFAVRTAVRPSRPRIRIRRIVIIPGRGTMSEVADACP